MHRSSKDCPPRDFLLALSLSISSLVPPLVPSYEQFLSVPHNSYLLVYLSTHTVKLCETTACMWQELEVAVSLRLFGSRCEELQQRGGGGTVGAWAVLPASLSAAAAAAAAYAELHCPAATAAAAAATAHRRAAECQASSFWSIWASSYLLYASFYLCPS